MPTALVNGRLVSAGGLVEGHAVVIEGGLITAVTSVGDLPTGAETFDLENRILAPGYIDTQVNGGGGVLFNDEPTVEGIEAIGRAHRRFGTTGFLPTLISDDLSVIHRAVAAVDAAIERGVPGALGIHIEGPFLNPVRRGIHQEAKLRGLDEEAFRTLTSLKRGKTMVTLAPESVEAGMITRLAAAGVIVSAGHTNATYATAKAAFENGVTGVTHLFNAMSPLTSRKPGMVGAALENQQVWCGLIVDGQHVDFATLRIALSCRPLDRFMLVTDAMPCVGDDRPSFELQGRTIQVRDGACFDQNGVLAGSAIDMAKTVANAHASLGLSLPAAIAMASTTPAAFLGQSRLRGTIASGFAADLILLNEDLTIDSTWIGGRRSF